MSGKPEHFEELARLVSGLLDGRLGPTDRARLELLLETDPAARGIYLQMMEQEIELECLVVPAAPVVRAPESLAPAMQNRRRTWRSAGIASAAAIVTFLLMLWLRREDAGPPLASAQRVASSWSAHFEQGAAPGWIGEFVAANLPPGSRGGIRAIETRLPHGNFHTIAAPEDWRAGFVSLTPASTLHVTYRLGAPAWVNVFCHTLGRSGENAGMFQLVGSGFPGMAGQWQTASIPFSLFQRKVPDAASGELSFTGGPPTEGERVAALFISAPRAFDLVIDRIWITPDGPASETIIPAP